MPNFKYLIVVSLYLAAICGGAPATHASVDANYATQGVDPIEYVAPEFRPALEKMKARAAGGSMPEATAASLPAFRERSRAYIKPFLDKPGVDERLIPGAANAPKVKVYVINAQPESTKLRPAILEIHGGGFIIGSAEASVPDMQALALKHDCVIVSVDYRLAPETPFPGSLEDNYAALIWLYDHAAELGVDRNRIAILGESAGGGHAAMLAIAARDRGEVPIQYQILIYPMLDDRTGSTIDRPEWMGYMSWSPAMNRLGWTSLLGVPAGSDKVPAGAVPARVENLQGLPPTFIGVGSIDLFVNEDIEYAQRLINAGVATELLVIPGGFHGFQHMMPDAENSKRFNAAVDTAISRAFSH